MKPEFWIMRVWCEPAPGIPKDRALTRVSGESDDITRGMWSVPERDGQPPTPEEWKRISHYVETGLLICLPLGQIAEPIECFNDEESANAYLARLAAKHPMRKFRVFLTAAMEES